MEGHSNKLKKIEAMNKNRVTQKMLAGKESDYQDYQFREAYEDA